MTTLRDGFTFEFAVESIIDGLDRRIAGERQHLATYRERNHAVLEGTVKGKTADRQRAEIRAEITRYTVQITALTRWHACMSTRPKTAMYRLTIADCAYFDLPKREPEYATGGTITNTRPFLTGSALTTDRTTNQGGPR